MLKVSGTSEVIEPVSSVMDCRTGVPPEQAGQIRGNDPDNSELLVQGDIDQGNNFTQIQNSRDISHSHNYMLDSGLNPVETRPANTKERIKSTPLLNTRDALDLLTFAATGEQLHGHNDGLQQVVYQDQNTKVGAASANKVGLEMKIASQEWKRFFLVKQGIVRSDEVIEYFDFYFAQLWPLLPIIPTLYSSPHQYIHLALSEPVLAISLVALASRYHCLSGRNGEIRSERIHWRTWSWVQKYFQSALWGSSCMRRPGAIAALLLFIEWHCKAMNSTEDFLGLVEDLESSQPDNVAPDQNLETTISHTPKSNSLTNKQRSNMTTLLEKLNIVAPAYRSNKMSWYVADKIMGYVS